jgi:NAD(P)-dependent dehydrogenase (short-subunit alcohol dehydrogenase family)
MAGEFDSKVVLITGASKGIGLACAAAFAAQGARVVGVSRSSDNLKRAQAELAQRGLNMCATHAVDLTDARAALDMVSQSESETGAIAVLVNSAGAARRFAPEELSAEAFQQGMQAKYFSYMNVMEPVVRHMVSRNSGAVVNIVGQGGRQAGVMHIAGGSANAALMLASVGYARAWAARGVRVNAINPGLTRTSRVDEGLAASARASGRDKQALLAEELARIPMGRMAEPSEIAEVALFLASSRASYVSGAIIPMDGCATSVI